MASTSPTILVVDDDPMTRAMLRAYLDEAGYTVIEASGGPEAIGSFEESPPDLVLLDVVMPEMDGFETCRRLRELPVGAAVPIIMLTGSHEVTTIRRAYEAGATDFEIKSVSYLVLLQRIQYLLRAKQSADELRDSEARLASAERIARAGSWQWHLGSGFHRWSPGMYTLVGLAPGLRQPTHELFLSRLHPDDRERLETALHEAAVEGVGYAGEVRVVGADGQTIVCRVHAEPTRGTGSERLGLTGALQDVTDLRSAQDRLHQLAFFDECTGLPNRNLLRQQIENAIADARRNGTWVAVLFLDLDNFKRVNDTLGHSAGDELLATIGARLKEAIRTSDVCVRTAPAADAPFLARHGGDEFIVCLQSVRQAEDASRVATRILAMLERSITVCNHELAVSASLGISLFPHDGDDPETLLKQADAAMYDAKNSGRNTFRFFDATMGARAFHRLALEAGLKRAVAERQFFLEYQPIVEVATGRVIGCESLVRWRHPDLGVVGPLDFIPAAEETGLMLPLGEWVLEASCRQAAAWRAAGLDLWVSVNVSGRQFWHKQMVEQVRRALEASGLPPNALYLEITEGVLIHDAADAIRTLSSIRDRGVRVALDDFGTGHSSLQYLRRFPVDLLKLDRVFVRDVERDRNDSSLTGAVAVMARSLGIEPLVEGVERPAQRDHLQAQGYGLMQGYLFGQPTGADEFVQRITGRLPLLPSPVVSLPSSKGVST